ncbi:MAG: glutamine--fructose-6-phosphate transaminase (isomerizing), partial [Gammaproteobacteria bacterium]|nr:glutamine--fructose-6-phosphate transaminase (isomerizing) [Gammaproteobacteria bacterium]
MCGIVGAISRRNVADILLEGLKRLEYRGYDSAGIALIDEAEAGIATVKTVGKVAKLTAAAKESGAAGNLGIAHTRWATHGGITAANAHPHGAGGRVALVHNGIIENHEELRGELRGAGYRFASETDTEVIAHLIHQALERGCGGLFEATAAAVGRLRGAYGLCVIDRAQPDRIVVARSDMSLVIGVGIGENFVASDATALGQVTDRFIYLEQGDIAQLTRDGIEIHNRGKPVERKILTLRGHAAAVDKGRHQHFMHKEIYEQPRAIRDTLSGRVSEDRVLEEAFGVDAGAIFDRVRQVQIVACGTSHHAGLVAKYWLESIARMPCQVDIASDYRYRDIIVQPGTLFVAISQSGETADTLAALRHAAGLGHVATLAICNVATSSLVREAD